MCCAKIMPEAHDRGSKTNAYPNCPAGLLTLLAAAAVPAAELKGSLKLFASGKPLRAAEAAEAIIYFRPKAPMSLPTPVSRPPW
jgi:hypothetical protein